MTSIENLHSRRNFILAGVSLYILDLGLAASPARPIELIRQITGLEKQAGGRLGIAASSADGKQLAAHRPNERFPFCSTFKFMLVAAVLARSSRDATLLQRLVTYKTSDLLPTSPVTKAKLETGATVAELCAGTLQYSDNAAANLLLKIIGGPPALTRYARSIGDHSFRLDRTETSLNTAIPDDLLDTTSPAAMSRSMVDLLLGNKLGATQRELFKTWLLGNTTGDKRIRAGVPAGWQVADKTGTGAYGTTNDIAVIWPVGKEPFALSIFYTQASPKAAPREEVVAEATRIVVSALA